MAKKSSIEKNKHRMKLVKQFSGRRSRLKTIADDMSLSMEERFDARLKLAELPRNSSPVRIRNRCEVTGRPRGYSSQDEDVAYRAAGTGVERPHSRPREVELVRE